jgi:hypothetical protein
VAAGDVEISFTIKAATIEAVHDLFVRRIGPSLVEERESFTVSVRERNDDWMPTLAVATVDRALAGAQLGGLVPSVGLLSLPYTAVEERYEGRGVYRALKGAMLAELERRAREQGLPPPRGNVSEEAVGSAQYRRKVERGDAIHLPLAYAQPRAQGLEEHPLALTYEPLDSPIPAFDPGELLRIVAALYRGLYRIERPEDDPTFRRIATAFRGSSASGQLRPI